MVQWSGGTLRSNIPRVVTTPGQQAACTRYSVAYLCDHRVTCRCDELAAERVSFLSSLQERWRRT